jgi:Tfp pilus assembly protein PilN
MANLIPNDAKKSVTREYWSRVIVVWCGLIAFALIIVTVLLVPVYVLINSQIQAYALLYSEASVQTDQIASFEKIITESNGTAERLLAHIDETTVSDYIGGILSKTSTGVTVTQFSYQSNTPTLSISGVADTRADLASFKTLLESSGTYERVELPISSLASERDIEYSMQLVLKQPTN